VAYEETESDLV